MIGVVVPYYQVSKGILAASLRSVFKQTVVGAREIVLILVDDCSPAPLSDELVELRAPDGVEIIILQSSCNIGPGAARNAGIDAAIDRGVKFVAFLDSDDQWDEMHLERALFSLDGGCDAYFSDHARDDDYSSAFEGSSPIFWESEPVRTALASIKEGVESRLVLNAAFVRSSLVYEYLFQTSTFVYNLQCHPNVRFDSKLRSAGEDHLFWFDIASESNRFEVYPFPEVTCGRGINIYFSSMSWDNPKAADRHGYRYLLFCQMILRGGLSSNEKKHLWRASKEMRAIFYRIFLRHLTRLSPVNWALFVSVIMQHASLTILGRIAISTEKRFGRTLERSHDK